MAWPLMGGYWMTSVQLCELPVKLADTNYNALSQNFVR